MRKQIIIGNWKLNKTNSEALHFLKDLNKLTENIDHKKVIFGVAPTAISLSSLKLANPNFEIVAQNIATETEGAYTGEISVLSLEDLKIKYTIIGHSERRAMFGDTDAVVNKKVLLALKHGIRPILCVGESLKEREENIWKNIITHQLKLNLDKVSDSDMEKVVIAYEPIWAIGTGKTASADQAEEVCAFIRNLLSKQFSKDVANKVLIQYGGSAKPSNSGELLNKENIDGLLVGGASLNAADFTAIIKSGSN